MEIFQPNGMVQRLNDGWQQPNLRQRYGRRKDGAPKDARTTSIAAEQDRRATPRDDVDPLRGKLFDIVA